MLTTKAFKNGNSQAIRVPVEISYAQNNIELEIERIDDELRIRPVRRLLARVLEKFNKFSPDFMSDGRGHQEQQARETL